MMEKMPGNYEKILGGILEKYNNKESRRFAFDTKRHAEILYGVNVSTISKLGYFPDEYLEKIFCLFIASYFIDGVLDLKNENSWNKPVLLFAGMDLVSDFRRWLWDNFDKSYSELFEKYYCKQLEYQVLEKKWEMPAVYVNLYSDYYNYYRKQIILTFPILLLLEYGVEKEKVKALYEIYKVYYSIILAVDDFYDVERDIENRILTPVIVKYFMANREFPVVNDRLDAEREKLEQEIFEMSEKMEIICGNSHIDFQVFRKVLDTYLDYENKKVRL